jgi:hypothetical protein
VDQDLARAVGDHNGLILLKGLLKQMLPHGRINVAAREHERPEAFSWERRAFRNKPWVYIDFIRSGALSMGGTEKPVSEYAAQ